MAHARIWNGMEKCQIISCDIKGYPYGRAQLVARGEKGLRGEKRSERKRTAELARDHKDLQDRHRPKDKKKESP